MFLAGEVIEHRHRRHCGFRDLVHRKETCSLIRREGREILPSFAGTIPGLSIEAYACLLIGSLRTEPAR